MIESPYRGLVVRNTAFMRAAMRDCLKEHGEAPFASHALYTQRGVLDDSVPEERHQGIMAGLAWGAVADAVVVYTNLGITDGMKQAIEHYERAGFVIERRKIGWTP